MRRTHPRWLSAGIWLALGLAGACGMSASAQTPAEQKGAAPQQSFVENDAGLRLEMLPAVSVAIGTDVTFRVSAKAPGYLIVVNLDPAGKVTQVYPRPDDVLHGDGQSPSSNRLNRGQVMTIPDPRSSVTGPGIRIAPPAGLAVALAILCDQPVQLLDLPDVPASLAGRAEALVYLADATRALQLASAKPNARPARPKWSFNAEFYLVKPP